MLENETCPVKVAEILRESHSKPEKIKKIY